VRFGVVAAMSGKQRRLLFLEAGTVGRDALRIRRKLRQIGVLRNGLEIFGTVLIRG